MRNRARCQLLPSNVRRCALTLLFFSLNTHRRNGGDTEVDVNDVSHALEKVTIARQLEDTWQVDAFGEISAVSRPPDEAIVLCLDLSESMNQRSAVSRPGPHRDDDDEPSFNVKTESKKLVEERTKYMNHDEIMREGAYEPESLSFLLIICRSGGASPISAGELPPSLVANFTS